jgi:predicted dithiol-disulfide oxidoreductase (DUF899 family)
MERDMNYRETAGALAAYREQIAGIRREMRQIQQAVEPAPVPDYVFARTEGTVRLTTLFGMKNDLIVIHNMGKSCPNCTLWADGFNGIYDHLANRAAFVVSSPDSPDTQRDFAAGRGWRFPMVSHQGTTFAADMGYRSEAGGWWPGVSVFQRRGEQIVRVADTGFHPDDDFCALWHLFGLLPNGSANWSARFSYG